MQQDVSVRWQHRVERVERVERELDESPQGRATCTFACPAQRFSCPETGIKKNDVKSPSMHVLRPSSSWKKVSTHLGCLSTMGDTVTVAKKEGQWTDALP